MKPKPVPPKKKVTLETVSKQITKLEGKLNKIMATQAEEAAALAAVGDQLDKAIAEITAAIAKAGATSPEVDAATQRLKAASQALDDLNPDASARQHGK